MHKVAGSTCHTCAYLVWTGAAVESPTDTVSDRLSVVSRVGKQQAGLRPFVMGNDLTAHTDVWIVLAGFDHFADILRPQWFRQ